jgi:hypothetical protein
VVSFAREESFRASEKFVIGNGCHHVVEKKPANAGRMSRRSDYVSYLGSRSEETSSPSVLLGEEDGAEITFSNQASFESDTTPAAGESSPTTAVSNMTSLWQSNMVAFRVDRRINWKLARSVAVKWLANTNYGS